jgi:hypothetical protein
MIVSNDNESTNQNEVKNSNLDNLSTGIKFIFSKNLFKTLFKIKYSETI